MDSASSRALSKAAASLQTAAEALQRTGSDTRLATSVSALATAVAEAGRNLPRQADVAEVQRTVADIRRQIERLPVPQPIPTAELVQALDQIRKSLAVIEVSARETVPRRNMRAVGETR